MPSWPFFFFTTLPVWVSLASAVAVPINNTSTGALPPSSSTLRASSAPLFEVAANTPSTPFPSSNHVAAATSTLSPSTTPAATPTPSTNGTSLDDADSLALSRNQACESLVADWSARSSSFAASMTTNPSATYASTLLTTLFSEWSVSTIIRAYPNATDIATSTLCDGVPRASGYGTTTTSVLTRVQTIVSTSVLYERVEPSPACTYDWRGCELELRGGKLPLCAQTGVGGFQNEGCILPRGGSCRANAGRVDVFYWPSSKDAAVLCTPAATGGGRGAMVTPTSAPSGPVTAVVSGWTFTSPSVYVSFSDIDMAPFCIPTYRDVVVAFPSESVSWVSMSAWRPVTKSMNWDDMNYPVPMSAYKGMEACQPYTRNRPDNCSTIFDDDYHPYLALPTDPSFLAPLNPVFTNCTNFIWAKYVTDPPIPLTTAGALVPPSAPDATTSATSAPAEQTDDPATSSKPAAAPSVPTATATAAAPPSGGTITSDHGGVSAPTSKPDPTSSPSDPGDDGGSGDNGPDPWDNLGSMISNIWGAQPTAGDPGSDPAPTTAAAGQNDPAAVNGGVGGENQNPQSDPGPANGASNTLPTVVTAGSGDDSSSSSNKNDPQSPTFVPVIVTVGTALASAAPAADPQGSHAGGNNGVVIGTTATLAPGQTTLLASHTIVAVSGPAPGLVVDGITSPLHAPASTRPPTPIAAAGGAIVAVDPSNPSGVVIGDQPLAPGGTTTVDGVRVVVPTAGGAVVVGDQTYSIPSAPGTPTGVSAGSGSQSRTITTIPLSPFPSAGDGTAAAATATGAILTLADGSKTFTASAIAPGTVVLGDGTTLSAGGPAATLWGSVISVAPGAGGGALVVGSAGGLGGWIVGGLGGVVGSVIAGAGATTVAGSSAAPSSSSPPSSSLTAAGGGGDDDPLATAAVSASRTRTEGDGGATAAATSTSSSSGARAALYDGDDALWAFLMVSVIPLVFSLVT